MAIRIKIWLQTSSTSFQIIYLSDSLAHLNPYSIFGVLFESFSTDSTVFKLNKSVCTRNRFVYKIGLNISIILAQLMLTLIHRDCSAKVEKQPKHLKEFVTRYITRL